MSEKAAGPGPDPSVNSPLYPSINPRPKSGHTALHTKLRHALSSKPKRFTKFALLPPELRLQIWQLALPDPVVHELYPSSPTSSPYSTFKTSLRSNRRTPPFLLHTSSESREVALKHYQLMCYDPPPVIEPRDAVAGVSHFWFSPERDTLFLNCVASIFLDVRWFLLDENPKAMAPMRGWRNVALDSLHLRFVAVVASDMPTPSHRLAQLFPDLENLSVAVDSRNSAKRRLRASLRPGHETRLRDVEWDEVEGADEIEMYFEKDYGEDLVEQGKIPELKMCRVGRKRMVVGLKQDLVYNYVGYCRWLRGWRSKIFRR